MNKLILYIEDDKLQRVLAKRCIERGSYDFAIEFAETGQKGIEMFAPQRYSLVVIDYNLPDMNAPEIALKLLVQCNSLSIIFLSGAFTDSYIANAESIGVKACITKGDMKLNLNEIAKFV